MSKELTEKWRNGELPREFYYIRDRIKEVYVCCLIDYPTEKDWVKEVLAPVPSYEEYKKMVTECHQLEKELVLNKLEPIHLHNCLARISELEKKNKNARKKVHILNEANEKKYNELCAEIKENKKLKERIADAEHILDEMGWADRGLIDDYFEKWGVK